MTDSYSDYPEYTKQFDDVSAAESEYIMNRRKNIGLKDEDLKKFGEKVNELRNKETEKEWKFNGGMVGLALSGGGIRSATFNLGVLQSLARKKILRFCDLLSTVSGGGYIGSCLSSLLDDPKASVEYAKFPFRFQREVENDERKEVKYLRQHSNYLVPDRKLFSLDVWRFIGLYISGLALTNLTTVSSTIFLAYFIYRVSHSIAEPHEFAIWILWSSLGAVTLMIIIRWFAALRNLMYKGRRIRGYLQGAFALIAALLAVFGSFILQAIYLPQLEGKTSMVISNLLNGATITSVMGLLFGILRSESEKIQKLSKFFFRISWVAMLPIVLAQIVRYIWNTDAFNKEIGGFPIIILLAIFLLILSFFTNTNRISMHHFYRDRLSETYIIKRKGSGQSEKIGSNESLTLNRLHSYDNGAPYQLINTTLNVPDSKNRYLRGRGVDYFVFSKYYCGAESTGYCRTDKYEAGETRLATAMAISGAAASPQMGTSTSPILTFIMTLLNVRLNRWMPNPNPTHRTEPKFWPYYFIIELLGKGNEKDRLLNLSDGGHIENLGIYELIKRRCEVIIASDATADPQFNFGDLANLIRKVRIDFGVKIDIDLSELRQNKDSKNTSKQFAVATIDYPDSPDGILIYIKSSITGEESEDLLAYRRKHNTFPDESTADQFFDEAQFESYRELGYIIGKELFP